MKAKELTLPAFAVKILKQYVKENNVLPRSTSDLSLMEQWLITQLYASQTTPSDFDYWERLEDIVKQSQHKEDKCCTEPSMKRNGCCRNCGKTIKQYQMIELNDGMDKQSQHKEESDE